MAKLVVLFGAFFIAVSLGNSFQPPHSVMATAGDRIAPAALLTQSELPVRYQASGAYDGANAQFVVFGGLQQPSDLPAAALAETWTWDGATWAQQAPPHQPPARAAAGLTFDPSRGQLVLFGGRGPDGLLSDTWTWDGSDWNQPAATAAPECCEAAPLVYVDNDGVVLFAAGRTPSGADTATWTWDGTSWTQRTAAKWSYSSSGWVQQSGAPSPSPRQDAGFSSGAAGAVLFGGCSLGQNCVPELGDTWLWDGSSWTQAHPAHAPDARVGALTAWDPSRGTVLLAGGSLTSSPQTPTGFGNLWEWDGSDWAPAVPPVALAAGQNWRTMFYDTSISAALAVDTDGHMVSLSPTVPSPSTSTGASTAQQGESLP